MHFLNLIKEEPEKERRNILIAAAVSGIANAVALGVINTAAQQVEKGLNFRLFLMFAITMVLYTYCLKYTFDQSLALFENMIQRMLVRLSKKIKSSELSTLETIGRATIYSRIAQETQTISQNQETLASALQSVVLLLFSSLYILMLSPTSFFLIFVMHSTTVFVFLVRDKITSKHIRAASKKGVELMSLIINLLDGFKQIKMRDRLAEDLFKEIEQVSEEAGRQKVLAGRLQNSNRILANSISFLILGAIVFVLPQHISTHHTVISELVAAVLFIFGPLSNIVVSIPAIDRANTAARNIQELEAQLDVNRHEIQPLAPGTISRFTSFKTIKLANLEFGYRGTNGQDRFNLGPIDLQIDQGKILFIVGGNGSGKSTFLKLLTGLYEADGGRILVDGTEIRSTNLQDYREIFSIIFGDFHLFQRLYGLEPVSRNTVLELLRQMEIDNKTDYVNDQFTELNLSTGQRKRVALVVSFLENRPVMIFDEWAADQDPHFRKHFYEEILPALRAQGKTVIAVTHDDHYFHIADRIIKLDYGRVEFNRINEGSGPSAEPVNT